jgi:prepilin-type N-terminal cleavage/methylation domain-containing protein
MLSTMGPQRSGFTLYEVMVAVVVLAIGSVVLWRLAVATSSAVALGRRWTAMAWAADTEVARLERIYRVARPACVPPPSGTRLTPDGIGLDWRVAGDSGQIRIVVSARARSSGRSLEDSVVTAVSCR